MWVFADALSVVDPRHGGVWWWWVRPFLDFTTDERPQIHAVPVLTVSGVRDEAAGTCRFAIDAPGLNAGAGLSEELALEILPASAVP